MRMLDCGKANDMSVNYIEDTSRLPHIMYLS
jgi:hypothetical protein